ncbi:MAG: glycosyltransferase family 4 protein [Candidatus Aminicenantes bacterium]
MSLFQVDAGKEWRGGQRQAFFLARELKRKGYSFRLYAQPDSPLHRKAESEGLPVYPLKMRSEADLRAVFKLGRAMKKAGCLLVHSHDAHSAAVAAAAASRAKVPVRVVSRRVDFPVRKNFFTRKKYIDNIDLVIAVSEEVKRVLSRGGIPEWKVRVIPSGVDYSPFEEEKDRNYLRRELNFSENNFLAGIVAHLADHKGHKYLIQAMRYLKEKAPAVKLVIVGEGPLQMELSRQVQEIHVDDMVFFMGFRDDVPRILASLDLFVLSSHKEGLGSSILDAMASRLPVVATQAGGIPEVVIHEQTGLLVPPKNPERLAEAILRVYQDPGLARRLGENGYRMVHDKFSASGMAEKIIREYERLAEKKRIKLPIAVP